jgi:DNA polymerase-1
VPTGEWADSGLQSLPYLEIWAVDFEFQALDGERPEPVCMVARELRTQRLVRCWRDELLQVPPFRTDPEALFVAYYTGPTKW